MRFLTERTIVRFLLRWPARLAAGAASIAVAAAILQAGTASPAARLADTGQTAGTAVSLASAPTAGLATAGPPGTAAQPVTLINGDRLAVTPGGPAGALSVTRLPGGPRGGIASLRLGGADYEIPYDALPYLGRGLDPGLFRLTTLLRGEPDGRLRVVLRSAGPMPPLPGITITGHLAGGAATGFLTAASARKFGAALSRQFIADHARASYGGDGLFGDGLSISLPGTPQAVTRFAPRAPAAGPAFRLDTLAIRGTDLAGRPDTGDLVLVVNADNATRFDAVSAVLQIFEGGVAKVSVPPGHYFALGLFFDTSRGQVVADRYSVLPQFTVSGSTSVAVSERAASSRIVMMTPRPAVLQEAVLSVIRTDAAGQQFLAILDGQVPQWVSPTRVRPTVGKLATVTAAILSAPAGAQVPYFYDLAYQDLSGLIPGQRFLIRPSGLAAVSARLYSAVQAPGFFEFQGSYPIQLVPGALLFGLDSEVFFRGALEGGAAPNLPAQLPLDYVTASPSLDVRGLMSYQSPSGLFLLQQASSFHSYQPGPVSENWNAYPLHPASDVSLPGARVFGPVVGSATRAGNELTMFVTPFTDSVPGHAGAGFGFGLIDPGVRYAGTFEVDQNGVKIAGGDATVTPFWQARLSPRPSVVRFMLDASRQGARFPLSAHSHTVWTWRSAPAPDATLPRPWLCGAGLADDFTTRCSAQPLLSLGYSLAGLRLDGSAAPGGQALTVSVSHFQPSASTAKITAVAVQVSFDSGRTWQDATVTAQGPGRFLAAYTAPASAGQVELRVNAADAGGSTVSETLPGAYQIAP
jgi:hypothetical protein